MVTTANYLLIAYVGGEQYHFVYEDCGDMWEALKQFYGDDYDYLIDKDKDGQFPIDVLAMDDGKAIKRYEVAFHSGVFDHFFGKGWKQDVTYTLDEFGKDIMAVRKKLDGATEVKDIIALWSDWCMDYDDENLWLDFMVQHPKGHCNRQHLQEKWDYCYEKYGSKAAMTMFWRELDNDNRAILAEYVTTQWHKN